MMLDDLQVSLNVCTCEFQALGDVWCRYFCTDLAFKTSESPVIVTPNANPPQCPLSSLIHRLNYRLLAPAVSFTFAFLKHFKLIQSRMSYSTEWASVMQFTNNFNFLQNNNWKQNDVKSCSGNSAPLVFIGCWKSCALSSLGGIVLKITFENKICLPDGSCPHLLLSFQHCCWEWCFGVDFL